MFIRERVFMNSLKRRVFIILFTIISILSLSAKDSVGITLQFGAIGSEKTFYSSTTISSETVAMPYTKTSFNPDIHIGINIPVFDVNDICFFNIDLGYDFLWDYSYGSYSSYQQEAYALSHRFSIQPQVTFVKSKFRFFLGTGITFGPEIYRYKTSLKGSKSNEDYTTFNILWNFTTGARYQLGNHLSIVADVTFFVNIFSSYKYDDIKLKASGSSTMEFLPKIGLIYQF